MPSFESFENVGLWIGAPFLKLTENCNKKWIRVIGALMIFPLFPLAVIGLMIISLGLIIEMFREI